MKNPIRWSIYLGGGGEDELISFEYLCFSYSFMNSLIIHSNPHVSPTPDFLILDGVSKPVMRRDHEVIDFTRSRVKNNSKLTNLMKMYRIEGYNGK